MLWLAITVLMAGAVALASWPFYRRTKVADGASADIYRSQLTELEREEAAGLISKDDARMARIEVQRRLIATAGARNTAKDSSMTLTDRTTFIAIATSVAIGSAIIYSTVGAPGIASSSQGFSASQGMAGGTPIDASGDSQSTQKGVAPVDQMIGSLEARLTSEPNDVEGWRMLGWSKFRTDDFSGAAAAYARAAKLAPDDAETLSAYGESLSRAAGGMVTPEATQALQAAIKADPNDARARFLLGLKKDQEGKPQDALNVWLAMLKSAEPNAPWYDEVRGRAVELSQSASIDIASRLPPPRSANAATADGPVGPSAAQVSEAQAMAPEARQAMVDGMVARLDSRLKANPNDLDGWKRLIRARRVLGQADLAEKALANARTHFSANAADVQALQEAMSAPLNLPPS
jgi:cytochrome c-type biogenesis protein CcmH